MQLAAGYLPGYLVSRRLGKKYSMQQMAHLGGKQPKSMIRAALVSLAKANPVSNAGAAALVHAQRPASSNVNRGLRGQGVPGFP